MGIYVQCVGSRRAKPDVRPSDLLVSARKWAASRKLECLFFGAEIDQGAWISFYPPAGGIVFNFAADHISFSAKTSVAGPGYHSALIDLCAHLGVNLGISWNWQAGGDETGFAKTRLRGALGKAFVEQFEAFCRFIRDNRADGERHVLNLEAGLAIDGYAGVATPLGPMPLEFFLGCLNGPDAANDGATEFFPWWGDEVDRNFWQRALLALLWSEVEWRAGRTPWEQHAHNCAKALGEKLKPNLDREMQDTLAELERLSADSETFVKPSAVGIGYRRSTRTFHLPGCWRINLPGYYIEQEEDDGETVCFWFGDEEIRGSAYTFALPESGQLTWDERLVDQPEHKTTTLIYRLPNSAKRSEYVEGFESAKAEFQSIDGNGNVNLLALSVFDRKPAALPRLANLAEKIWFDPSKSQSGKGH